MKTCVIGLGNIGFQLFMDLYRNNVPVSGVDVKPDVITALKSEGFNVSTNPREFSDVDVWLVAISTGLQMEQIWQLIKTLRPKPGALVSIESTLIPGTMNQLAAIFTEQNYQLGNNLFFIHVPHRINFGIDNDVFEQPRVIGGITPACLTKGMEFYQPFINRLVPVSDVRLAELAKITENSIRHLNIALAESLYQYCLHQSLPFHELRAAVNSKENVRLLDIDYGIGGECLTKDMQFLSEVTNDALTRGALEVDSKYRDFLFEKLKEESGVLISGVTYKPGLKATGFSRAIELYRRLEASGTKVYVADPLLSSEELHRLNLREWHGEPISAMIKRGKISNEIHGVVNENQNCIL